MEARLLPFSLNPMWPVRPSPRICRRGGQAGHTCRSAILIRCKLSGSLQGATCVTAPDPTFLNREPVTLCLQVDAPRLPDQALILLAVAASAWCMGGGRLHHAGC